MADVFISYHENSAGTLAQQIADTLESRGISCWIARRDMSPGADFSTEIPPQIENCKLFLLLLDESVYQSEHMHSEAGLAFSRYNKRKDIQILPVEIGAFERKSWVQYYLIHIQSVKFSAQPDAQELNQLAAQIAKLLGRELQSVKTDKNPFMDSDFYFAYGSRKMESVKNMELFLESVLPPQETPTPSEPEPPPKIIEIGKCGYSVTYRLYETGQLVIAGVGPMRDVQYYQISPWFSKSDKIYGVRIKEGVTHIGGWTFSNCKNLKSVSIPDSVTSIGDYAFRSCARLKSVSVPAKLKIGRGAFPWRTKVTRREKP